jgi:hypothetical protein
MRNVGWWSLLVAAYALLMTAAAPASALEATALRELIEAAESSYGVNSALIEAIIVQESGRWPWALNVNGASSKPGSREEAEQILTQSGDNVDIGLMQINYRQWGRVAGLSKRELLDPWINVAVGTQILRLKMTEEPGWAGVARYHSATPWRNTLYAAAVSQLYSALNESQRSVQSPETREEPNPLRVAVHGIVILPDLGVRIALLSEPTFTQGAAQEFSRGKALGEWTVSEILADRVVLRMGEQVAEIRAR